MFRGSKGLLVRQAVVIFLLITGSVAVTIGLVFGVNAALEWFFPGEIPFELPDAAVVVAGLIVAGSFSIIGSYVLNWRLERELDDIQIGIRMLSRGRLSFRWGNVRRSELEEIRTELNHMAEKWEKQVQLLQALAEEKEKLADKAREAGINDERQRLARELHDAVSQQLFALSMSAAAAVRLMDKDPEKARERVASLEAMAQKALSEMRALLLHLRPVQLSEETLGEALRGMLDELQQKGILKCSYNVEKDLHLNRSIEANLLRIVQEAVANTLRHAQAQNLRLSLSSSQDLIHLSVEDDGIGFDPDSVGTKKVSYGLQTMRERAEECGGFLNIVSVKGKGTRIDVRVPIPRPTQKGGEQKDE